MLGQLAPFSKQVWDGLLPFPEARRRARERLDALEEFGSIICRHSLQDVVGLALIHKHFKLAPDERLVEVFEDGGFRIVPSADQDVTPYLWKVEKDPQGEWQWFPIEFVKTVDAPTNAVELAARVGECPAFLAELSEAFVRLGVKDIFGLNTLHRDAVEAAPSELLIETNDEANRTLEVTAYPESVGTEEISPTYWRVALEPASTVELTPLQRLEVESAGTPESASQVPDIIALNLRKLLDPHFPAFYRRVAMRCLAVREAVDRDLTSLPLGVLVDQFRERRSLRSDESFRAWLDERCMTRDELSSTLREEDREARLRSIYRQEEPALRTKAAFYRRLVEDLSSQTGRGRNVLLRTQPSVRWDASMIRALKWNRLMPGAREASFDVLRTNRTFFAENSWMSPSMLSDARIEEYLSTQWGTPISKVREAAQDRGFANFETCLEAARYTYVYQRVNERQSASSPDVELAGRR
jgi:hypothetical protein